MDGYNENVIKAFKNPKNMGEIKNADGIGKVGNPICLTEKEIIHLNDELAIMKYVSVGNRVLTHDGSYQNIINKSVREYNNSILMLKNKLGNVSLTPEHLVFAVKVPKGDRFLRTKNKKNLVAAWYHAQDLEKGDVILYPLLKETKDTDFINTDIQKQKYDFRSKKIPKKIPVNDEFLRLAGYFLAEGYTRDESCKTYFGFTLHINEKDIAEDIKKIIYNLFGIEVKLKEIPQRKTLQVLAYNAALARLFKKMFGKGAQNKKVPHFMMLLPTEKQKALLYGLWKGDGYINLTRQGARAVYSTISIILAQQIKMLLLRQKIVPSIYCEDEKIKNGTRHKKNYRIHIGQRDSLHKLASIFGLKYYPKSYASVDSWFDDDYLYTPVTRVQSLKYSGKVYNLEVENSHSFTTQSFCLHNCGDLMWVYIKISKDKKGEEFIKDIKVKTFGCVAAIATSSTMTEMIKGKTIKEAIKLTNKDVAGKLGGLPKEKMHCSNLAADALHKAIEDYRKKKR